MALEGKTTVMKWFVIILFAFTSLGSAEDWTVQPDSDEWRALFDPPFTTPTEISADTPLRKQLFDLLRPHIERERKASKGAIRFQGDLKAFKNWAFFMGITFDQNGEPIRFAPLDNTETSGLWLRTRKGWRLVDYAVGFSDPAYWIWVEQYGIPRQLVGIK